MSKATDFAAGRTANTGEFIRISDSTYCVNIGDDRLVTTALIHVLPGSRAVLVDPGFLPSPGLTAWLDGSGLTVSAVICTHLHIDHAFNCTELKEHYGAEIFAPRLENRQALSAWVPDCPITYTEPEQTISIDGADFKTVFTPGHSPGHQLVITPDGICYLGDAILTKEMVASSKLPYIEEVQPAIESMERIRETDRSLFVASHRGILHRDKLDEAIELNVNKEIELYNLLRELSCKGPVTSEQLVDSFLEAIGVGHRVFKSAAWRLTVKTRIKELERAGELTLAE